MSGVPRPGGQPHFFLVPLLCPYTRTCSARLGLTMGHIPCLLSSHAWTPGGQDSARAFPSLRA